MIELFATKEELLKALTILEKAEEKGFEHCLVSFKLTQTGKYSSEDIIECNDQLILKADPEDPLKNWGRIDSDHIEWYKYENGQLKED